MPNYSRLWWIRQNKSDKLLLKERRGGVMPYFCGKKEFECRTEDGRLVSKFTIKANPIGPRRLFHFLPYITGNDPRIHLKVQQVEGNQPFHILVRQMQPEERAIFWLQGITDLLYQTIIDIPTVIAGERYTYNIYVSAGLGQQERFTLLSFKAVWQEDLVISLLSLFAGAFLGNIDRIFG